MGLTQLDSLILRIIYLLEFGIIVFHVLGRKAIVSPLFYMTFIMVSFLWISIAFRKFYYWDLVCIIIIVVSFMNISINSILCDTALSFEYYKKFIMFSITVLFFQVSNKIIIDRKTEKYILTSIKAISIFLILMYFFNTEQMFMLKGYHTDYLTFGLTNPNLTSMFLLCVFFVHVVEVLKKVKLIGKIYNGSIACLLGWFIWQTKSRNAIIVLVFFVIVFGLVYKTNRYLKINKIVATIISIWPGLFGFLYLIFIKNKLFLNTFDFMIGVGKNLDSRENIWNFAIDNVIDSPIIGAYSQISDGTGVSQLHNSHIDIMASYGLLIFVLICCFLYYLIWNKNYIYREQSRYLYMLGFVFTLLMGMGEAALFSGGVGIYLYSGMFILLKNMDRK